MKRRKIQYKSFAGMLADVEHLKRDGYQRVGNWDLGTVCCHIADAIERSMDGFLTQAPILPRLFSPIILPIVLKTRRIPSGVKVAKEALPQGEQIVDVQLARLRRAAERYDQHVGPVQPHPIFGRISPQTHRRLHLIHAAHHLSFLADSKAGSAGG